MIEENIQELNDLRASGKENDWNGKKERNYQLSRILSMVPNFSEKKLDRISNCGNFLWFTVGADGGRKLLNAFLCKYRFCPLCVWRRSMKTFANTARIINYLGADNYQYILLTLTIKNVPPEGLKQAVDAILAGWKKLFSRKIFRELVKGFYRGLEVTRNNNRHSKSYGTFHPHIHVLLAVKKSYGKKKGEYISKEQWAELWKSCMDLDYKPVIDVRAVKPKMIQQEDGSLKADIVGAVCEVSKYPVKDSDYIVPDDLEFSVETVGALDKALHHRRLVQYGGVFLEAQKALKIKDIESDDDLISIGEEEKRLEPLLMECYAFNYGFMRYGKIAEMDFIGDPVLRGDAQRKTENEHLFK